VSSPPPLLPPVLRQWLLLLASLAAGVSFAVWNGWFWRADLLVYDAGPAYGPAPADVVIVAVDDASLAQIGGWPFRRALHAALLQRLRAAGVRAVALDFVFTEPDPVAPADDPVLADAIAHGPPTVLPLIVNWQHAPTRLAESPPLASLARAAAGLAHVQIEPDGDGIVRSVYLREGLGAPNRSYLALALLEASGRAPAPGLPGERHPGAAVAADAWVRDYHVLIPFLGPAGHFRQVSYVDVLRGKIPDAELRGTLVLVGATAQGLGDAYPTPTSGAGIAMPGVEISANVLQALRSKRMIAPLARSWSLLCALLPLAAAFLGFLRLSPRGSLLWTASLWLATLAASTLALRYGDCWWPPTPALAALVLAYPLWSWRRLDATQSFLDEELARLEREPLPLPRPGDPAARPSRRSDVLQRRIDRTAQATARLRQLRQLLSDTIAALPDALVLVGPDGRIVLANPGAATLFAAADLHGLAGQPAARLLGELLGSAGPDYAVLAQRAPCAVELAHGSGRDFMLRLAPFHDAEGVRAGTVVEIADISALKRAERERADTIRFLSHDLRSPSSSLLGLAAMLRDPGRAPPAAETARRIESLAGRTLELADGFIALSRASVIEASQFEPLDLRDALQDAIDEVWASAAAKRVTIEAQAGTDEARVHGDRQLLARALANLIGNAVKFSPAQSRVVASLERRAAGFVVSIRDHGPGIARDRQARLFQRYARGLHHGDADPGGIGLGLEFVRIVAHKHGGSVSVESAAGQGATFSLVLPPAAAASGENG
jgi:CHASE2 domain-containing sensor protein/signal transduction histidine kinase